MSSSRPDSDGADVTGRTDLERVMLDEVRRLGRAIDSLSTRVEQRLDKLAEEIKAETTRLEERVRQLEIESAKAAVRIGIWGALAGVAAAGVAEAIGQALLHH